MSFLAAPVAYVFTRFAPVSPNVDIEDKGPNRKRTTLLLLIYFCTVATSGLLTALAAAILFGFIESKTASWRAAAAGTATYALATPTWGWATSFFGHAAAGALLIIGFVLVDKLATGMGRTRDRKSIAGLILVQPEASSPPFAARALASLPRISCTKINSLLVRLIRGKSCRRPQHVGQDFPRGVLAAGLALGTAITVEFPSAVPAAIILSYLTIRTLGKQTFASVLLITAAVGAVAAATQIPLLLYNAAAFGAPFKLGYSNVVGFESMKTGFYGIRLPKLDVMGEIIFGSRRGIIWLSPVLVFAVVGTLDGLRREGERARSALIASVAVFYLLLNSSYAYWDGGWSTGPRHITPAFPFLALGLGMFYARASVFFRTAILALVALSIIINLMCVSVSMTSPKEITNPLRELILPSFFRGDLEQTVLHAFFGAHGLWQLIPLLAAWLILGIAFYKVTASRKADAASEISVFQPATL